MRSTFMLTQSRGVYPNFHWDDVSHAGVTVYCRRGENALNRLVAIG